MKRSTPFRVIAAAFLWSAVALAQTSISVDKLVEFIRSAIAMKSPDKQVAGSVAHLKLSQKLDQRTIEQLQGEGAGPKTVAALRALAAATADLAAAPKVEAVKAPPPIPPPSYDAQQKVIADAREYARNYSSTLPDFICTQVTRRYYGQNGHENWHLNDTVTSTLTYFEQHENYKVKLVNNQIVDRPMEALGGATSSGEFGTMLKQIFDERTGAEFHWDHWGTLRGHRVYVFNYHVEQGNSQWMLDYEHRERIQPAYEGLVYIDKETGKVLRITLHAVELPPSFPIQDAHTQLDYDYTKISGQNFLLPLVAQVRMRHDNILTKNDNEFRMYRKYGVESSITFTPDALDESKIQEKPPK
ncbi:MAG TPA: hypothetical protein DEQ47_08890 [Solibacterales bacterium]|nr:hypothetical protein [Bryobacterales bacterium]